jgi:hypothetical protein
MAVRIRRHILTHEQVLTIKDMCTFTPVVEYTTARGHSGYGDDDDTEGVGAPVSLYDVKEGYVHLPYCFSRVLLKYNHNLDKNYPRVEGSFVGTLLAHQVDVVKEALDNLTQNFGTLIGTFPGSGKTIMGTYCTTQLGLKGCVLIHRKIFAQQWKTTFEKVSSLSCWIVGETSPPAVQPDMMICMSGRWNTIPVVWREAVGTLIIDEAHAFCTPSAVGSLLNFFPKYVILESATIERDDEMHNMLYAIAGTNGVFRDVSHPFTVVKVETGVVPKRDKDCKGSLKYDVMVKSLLYNDSRNALIYNLLEKHKNECVLVLTSQTEHVRVLYEYVKENVNKSVDFMCGNKKTYTDCSVLIGTSSKIGTGFDQATFCENYSGKRFRILIICFSIKKYSILVQNVGRVVGRGENPIVYHFVDNDNLMKSHWNKCKKWYAPRCVNKI